MRIVKKINNNVALALDGRGRDVVVFGKGLGFPSMPYELDEPSRIQRSFCDVDAGILQMATSIPDDVLLASSDIVDLAHMQLDDCKLNPNLVFTLADHLKFAMERMSEGIEIKNPLSDDVAFVYPREMGIGIKALGMAKSRTGVTFPDAEACSIALHLVNAEVGHGATGDMHLIMESTSIIERATTIVENELGVKLDRTSYGYVRFIAHLRYLIGRLMKGLSVKTENGSLFRQAAKDFPEAYACAYAFNEYLKTDYGWACTDEELLYLMMHVNRLRSSTG